MSRDIEDRTKPAYGQCSMQIEGRGIEARSSRAAGG
jgi:hypothetical protein